LSRFSLRPFNTFSYCPALAAASPVAPAKYELAINLKSVMKSRRRIRPPKTMLRLPSKPGIVPPGGEPESIHMAEEFDQT
jgi:hypothetical protein